MSEIYIFCSGLMIGVVLDHYLDVIINYWSKEK